MGHHQDGLPVVPVQRLEQIQYFVAGLTVQITGRLVAEQQCGIRDDRAGDPDPLLFAAGEMARIMSGAVRRDRPRGAPGRRADVGGPG